MIPLLPYIHCSVFIVTLLMSGYILYKNHRSALNIYVALIFLFIAFWNFTHIFLHHPLMPYNLALKYMDMGIIGFTPFIGVYLLFTLKYINNKRIWIYSPIIIAMTALLCIIFTWSQFSNRLIIKDIFLQNYGWRIIWNQHFMTYLFFIYFVGISLYSMFLLSRHYFRVKSDLRKQQTSILLVTSVLPFTLGLFSDMIFTYFNIVTWLPESGNITVVIWIAGLLFATKKFKLFTFTPAIAADNIINNMSDALFMIKPNGEIFQTNKATEKLLKIQDRNVANKNILTFFSSKQLENISQLALSDNQIFEGEITNKRGKTIPVSLSTMTMRQDNMLLGFVCLVRDISHQKKIEENLEMLVKKRTIDLVKAKKKAEQADKLKSAFLANMSHEI
ncbi:MAG: PAS domain S-box protein, partial [Bacteroidales bacterium]|nr:PAS domain S-box protein [Bacteroidales bacterium]